MSLCLYLYIDLLAYETEPAVPNIITAIHVPSQGGDVSPRQMYSSSRLFGTDFVFDFMHLILP